MRKVSLAALAWFIWCSATPGNQATAAQIVQFPFVPPWTGGAFSNDQTGQFSSCIASVSYRSGITMLVMITRDGAWSLGFTSQTWNLQSGQQISLSMTFDGQNPWIGSATAANSQLIMIPMAMNSELINAFRAAYQMQVYAVGRVFSFNLNGTSRIMVELARCVGTELALERGEPPPQYAVAPPHPLNPPASPPVAPSASSSQFELAATRIASNLLLAARLPNARLLSLAETPAVLRGRGAVWTSDAGLGAVELISAAAGKDPQHVASALITNDGTACKGEFASGRSSELVDDKVVTKAFTGCKDSAGTRTYRYFVVQGPTGDFIIYELANKGRATEPANDSPLREDRFQAAAVKAAFLP